MPRRHPHHRIGRGYGIQILIGKKSLPIPTANLIIWAHGDDLVTQGVANGGAVNNWRHLSGNGYLASQGTSGQRPTLVTNAKNGHAAVRFDGVDDFLTFNNPSLAQPNTYFVVATVTAGGAVNKVIIGSGTGSQNSIFIMGASSDHVGIFDGATTQQSAAGFAGAYHLFTHQAKADPDLARVDGTQVVLAASGSDASGTIRVGANSVPGGFCPMDLAEIIMYNEASSAGTISAVEAYLNAKYAIF